MRSARGILDSKTRGHSPPIGKAGIPPSPSNELRNVPAFERNKRARAKNGIRNRARLDLRCHVFEYVRIWQKTGRDLQRHSRDRRTEVSRMAVFSVIHSPARPARLRPGRAPPWRAAPLANTFGVAPGLFRLARIGFPAFKWTLSS